MTAQITVSTSDGRSFVRPVDRDEFAVGRDSRNHLVLGDRQVSKFHCQICREADEFLVKDLNSSNGTLINGIRVDGEVTITTGDRIRVGPYELIFAAGDSEPGYLRRSDSSPVPASFQPGGVIPPERADVSDLLDPMGDAGAGGGGGGLAGAPATDPSLGQARSIQLKDPAAPGDGSSDRWHSDSGLTPREGVAYLEIVDGDGKGHMITVGSRGVTVGAGSRNNLVLDDPFVSRQHCRVDPSGGLFVVKDLGSTNGIRVDGEDVAQAELSDGTRLQVGGVLMVFRRPGQAVGSPSGSAPVPPPPAPPSADSDPPTVKPDLTRGPPPRSGRSTATVREMSALPTSSSKESLRPPPKQAAAPSAARAVTARKAAPDKPSGVVQIGSLRFKRWQIAFLGFISALLVLALLYQAAGYMFDLEFGGDDQPQVSMFDLGLQAYTSGDWDTAEAYLEKVGADDPRAAEAATYLENIRLEKANAERSERVAMLMQEYGYSQDPGFFERAHAVYQEIPPKSRYYEDARALVEPVVPVEAARLVEEAAKTLEDDRDLDAAAALLDRAEAYDAEIDGLAELREVIEAGPRRVRRMMRTYRENQARPDDEGDDADTSSGSDTPPANDSRPPDRGNGNPSSAGASAAADAAAAVYLGGDPRGARDQLEKAIAATSDPAQKLELQEILGRIDRIERSVSSGDKALDAGDLDKALDRYESAYRDMTRLDTAGDSVRRGEIRQSLAECRYRRGRAAFDKDKFAKANFEWASGRKAYAGHPGIERGRRELEEVAKGTYNEAYLAEREGTERSIEEARKLYEQVMAIAPQGDGFQYHDKASSRLAEL